MPLFKSNQRQYRCKIDNPLKKHYLCALNFLSVSFLTILYIMKLSEFKFDLPQSLISLYPAERGDARLMVLNRQKKTIEHRKFSDIIDYFDEGDVMVVNNTKVFPARLYGQKEKTGAQIEVFLLRELNREMRLWDVLVDPARKIRVGNKLYFGDSDLVAEVIDNTTSRGRTIRFLYDGDHDDLMRAIDDLGETPLPREIARPVEDADREHYQTIFAEHTGAVAAPTAGLHFTKVIMRRMEIKGIEFTPITLHVGVGTFRQVDVEDLTKHKTDSENFIINEATANLINNAMDNKRRVCAIGTTSLKALESSVSANVRLKPFEGWTDKFIFPPYEFKITDSLLTSFHLPESILLMMTCAFGGYDFIMHAYEEALKEKYKFFSYGDAMLIL
jgi:S-adenosylmethionine:tRNA ribosyltransferase-isomerase